MNKDNKSVDGGPASTGGSPKRSPAAATDAVGRKLKASYGELLREPIPDKFMQLLQQLDDGEAKTTADADGPAAVGQPPVTQEPPGKTDQTPPSIAARTRATRKDDI